MADCTSQSSQTEKKNNRIITRFDNLIDCDGGVLHPLDSLQ